MGDIREGCSLVVTMVQIYQSDSIALLLVILICTLQKASIGMTLYSLSLICVLFDPAIATSFFNCLTCCCSFYCI